MKRSRTTPSGQRWRIAVIAACASILAGCASTARDTPLVPEPQPPGPVYVGWRIYQDRCAGCHGVDAAGTAQVPDLLERVREMSSRRFVNLVLQRYDWNAASGDAAARTALLEDILQRKEAAFAMPAWQDEPQVSAHVLDLYAYLAARAEGAQGPGRPAR